MQEIVSLQPEKLANRLSLAAFYIQQKQDDKAEKTLRDAVQANPDDADRYLILADFLIKHAKVDKAEEELRAAIKAQPKNYKIRLGLARLYETVGDADKAILAASWYFSNSCGFFTFIFGMSSFCISSSIAKDSFNLLSFLSKEYLKGTIAC